MWLQHSDEPQQTMQIRLGTKDPRQTETQHSTRLSRHQKNGIIIKGRGRGQTSNLGRVFI